MAIAHFCIHLLKDIGLLLLLTIMKTVGYKHLLKKKKKNQKPQLESGDHKGELSHPAMIAEPERKKEASFPARTQPVKNHKLFFYYHPHNIIFPCNLLRLLWGDWLTTHHGFRSWSVILCQSQVNSCLLEKYLTVHFKSMHSCTSFVCGSVFLFHFDTCLGVESMGYVVILGLIFAELPDCFPKWLHHFLFSTSSVWGFHSHHILKYTCYSLTFF